MDTEAISCRFNIADGSPASESPLSSCSRNYAWCKVLLVMTSRKWFAVGCGSALISIIGFVVFHRANHVAPPFEVAPLPKGVHALSPAEVEDILSANFVMIRRVQQVPAAVKADYAALSNEPFEMVNPGQTRSTDVIIPGVPNKELVFVGLAGDCAVLMFKRPATRNFAESSPFTDNPTPTINALCN